MESANAKNVELTNQVASLTAEMDLLLKKTDEEKTKNDALIKNYLEYSYHFQAGRSRMNWDNTLYLNAEVARSISEDEFFAMIGSITLGRIDALTGAVSSFSLAEKKLKLVEGITDTVLLRDIELRLQLVSLELSSATKMLAAQNAYNNYLNENTDKIKEKQYYDDYSRFWKESNDYRDDIPRIERDIELLWEKDFFPEYADANLS